MVYHKLRDMLISTLNFRLKKNQKLQFAYLNHGEYIRHYIVIITFGRGGPAGSDQCLGISYSPTSHQHMISE